MKEGRKKEKEEIWRNGERGNVSMEEGGQR